MSSVNKGPGTKDGSMNDFGKIIRTHRRKEERQEMWERRRRREL